MNDINAQIGNRIKRLREQKGYSQQTLARKTGYASRSSINKIEIGERPLTQPKIILFANALGVTPAYIMGWDEQELTDENISLSKHEMQLILAYRANPAMQGAIDKLLNIPEEYSIEKDITDTVRDINNIFSKKV